MSAANATDREPTSLQRGAGVAVGVVALTAFAALVLGTCGRHATVTTGTITTCVRDLGGDAREMQPAERPANVKKGVVGHHSGEPFEVRFYDDSRAASLADNRVPTRNVVRRQGLTLVIQPARKPQADRAQLDDCALTPR